MKLLVIGGGGREHAIVKKLKENPDVTEIYCAPGNGGISYDAVCVPVKADDVHGVVDFAVKNKIDFAVVSMDAPLVLGMVDALNAAGIKAFGPDRAAARIEGSKVFGKNLMKKYGIPTAAYEVFDDAGEAVRYIKARNEYPVVIKADGPALGKGVFVCEGEKAAVSAVNAVMRDRVFGESGAKVVVEEFLTGPEVSVLSFTDGKTIVPMVSSMDHKRALDGDKGLNTGGMGAIAPNLFYTDEIAKTCMEKIFLPTINGLREEGAPFRGCLYFGLMLTPRGPKVIEYNCRFGDPEAQVVLPLLETDLLDVMLAVCDGKLDRVPVRFSKKSAACVILASKGYPEKYAAGYPIYGLCQGQIGGVTVFHAGTRLEKDTLLTSGGRVLGVTAVAGNLRDAVESAYKGADHIFFEGLFRRNDIGKKALRS